MDYRRLEKVLIIKPSSLGDVIHALPVASALKAALPAVGIDWVVGRGYEGVLEGNPAIGRVIVFDRNMLKGPGWSGRLMGFLRELRREHYDLVIDLQGLLRSGLITAACMADRSMGFANAREGATLFYTELVPVPATNIHAVDRYMLTLAHIGINTASPCEFSIRLSGEDRAEADALLEEFGIRPGEPFAAFAPSARWDTKRWPAANFVEVADRIHKGRGLKPVFVGTADEARLMDGVPDAPACRGGMAFGRTTLKVLGALLSRASVLVTNDSGPMHMAAAAGTPVVAVFGPTDPGKTGPYGDRHRVLTADIECRPCFRRSCDNVKCLSGVTAEQVYEAASSIIG
ncbi:MAG: glycosyltransferase family 9 protein [Nitrospirae bacterium]|nr:glycosyltransferase family 9 protein [Nitrospirota bacterium]MBI5694800.1 glycosyltransferase family 9 protein [Nitrospirota bacterium]